MRNYLVNLSALAFCFLFSNISIAQPKSGDNLQFDSLARRWDESMPLGNGGWEN